MNRTLSATCRAMIAGQAMFAVLIAVSAFCVAPAGAQEFSSKAELERAEKRRSEAADSLRTLADLLVSRKEQAAVVKELKTALSQAKEAHAAASSPRSG